MTEIAYALTTSEAIHTHATTTWTTKVSISSAGLEDSTDYLLICSALVGGDNAGVNTYNVRLSLDGTNTLDGSYGRHEPVSTPTSEGGEYFYCNKITTAATAQDIVFQMRQVSGTDTGSVCRVQMLAIKVDDTDTASDALHSDDYKVAYTETNVEIVVGGTFYDGESVVAGNGSDDWVVLAFGNHTSGSTASAQQRLNVGGTITDQSFWFRNDGADRLCTGVMNYLPALATDTTVKAQYSSGSTLGDITQNGIVMIRLNAFEDFAGIRDTASHPTNITPVDTDVLGATLTHTTSTAATRDWVFFGQVHIEQNESTKRIDHFMDHAGVIFAGDHSGRYRKASGGAPIINSIIFDTVSIADATDTDIDMGVQEEADTSPVSTIESGVIFGFTTELASAGGGGGVVLNKQFNESGLNG